MTILPELRDALLRSRPPVILPELRDGLAHRRRRARRRPALVGGIAFTGVLATAGALAATGVLQIPTGEPVEPHRVERDAGHGVGVPVGATAQLLPLRVADPAGGPPWGLRMVTTSRGLACLQLGRVVGDELGVLGQDGIEKDDGRFHPLPIATAASALTPCQIPDGAGRFFAGVDRLTYASGDTPVRACRGREMLHRTGGPRCPAVDERRVAYGLLGPEAARITYVDGTSAEVSPPLGAYLSVRPGKGESGVTAMGGTPVGSDFDMGVARIDYRDGTSCPGKKPRAFCPPKGYVKRTPAKPGAVRARLTVTMGTRKFGKHKRVPEIRVRFRAPAAITDAQTMYLFEGRVPDSPAKRCHGQIFYTPTNHDIARGDVVKLFGVIPPDCKGTLRAQVILADISYHNGKPKPGVVGTIVRRLSP